MFLNDIKMISTIFIFIFIIILIPNINARTMADTRRELELGDTKALMGSYLGNVELIRQGRIEGASVHCLMTDYIGEQILKIGKAGVDFPIAPILHLSFNGGTKEHLESAFYLMRYGSKANSYLLPYLNNETDIFIVGYPPAYMFLLGLGRKPENSMAAFFQRLYLTYQETPTPFINYTSLELWLNLTGNPPLLHIPILSNFFDGAFVLINDVKVDINEADQKGVTALHLAAWNGDASLFAFLIHNGADVTKRDMKGRSSLHYLVMRGHGILLNYFLQTIEEKLASKTIFNVIDTTSINIVHRLLLQKDRDNRTLLDIAILNPPLQTVVDALTSYIEDLDIYIPLESSFKRASLKIEREIDYNIDIDGTRGGWIHKYNKHINHQIESSIDIINIENLTKKIFKRDYFTVQRPLLISGQMFSGQNIWAYWEKEEFVNRYGDLILLSGERMYSKDANPWKLEPIISLKLADWIVEMNKDSICHFTESLHRSCVIGRTYDNNMKLPILKYPWVAYSTNASLQMPINFNNDIKIPDILKICDEKNNNNIISLYVGPAGSGVPFQTSSASWDLLITGQKAWYFISPGEAENITGISSLLEHKYNDQHIQSSIEWVNNILPNLKKKGIVSEVIQYSGDVIFIPHDWHYLTLYHTDSISISQEFCASLNTNHRIHPLGFKIYGGKDKYHGIGEINRLIKTEDMKRRQEEFNHVEKTFPVF